ncbi:ral-GDS-related protein-like [Nycticebus coucang]|uniref:ral-GDS-related protein-like n=1 Tax=Nycticebus coucang TaxID=9470 RepID=UPI00234C2879|nr:ral-GDS-related protein-like [Nycticebus coucang]
MQSCSGGIRHEGQQRQKGEFSLSSRLEEQAQGHINTQECPGKGVGGKARPLTQLPLVIPRTTSSIYISWPVGYPVVFDQSLHIAGLMFQEAHIEDTASTSHLGHLANVALAWLEQLGPIGADPEGEMATVDQLHKEGQALPVLAIEPVAADLGEQRPALEPGAPASLDLPLYMEPTPGPGSRAAPAPRTEPPPVTIGKAQPEAIPGLCLPWTVPEKKLRRAGPSPIMAYTDKHLDEQLTLMDAGGVLCNNDMLGDPQHEGPGQGQGAGALDPGGQGKEWEALGHSFSPLSDVKFAEQSPSP